MKKKKIMLYAYTKFNLGDDLFIKIICDRYPKTQFLLYAPKKYKVVFKDMKNLEIIPSDSLVVRGINYVVRVLNLNRFSLQSRTANRCNAIVKIGGSLFMQTDKWKSQYRFNRNMKVKDKPIFLLGPNFGPYNDSEFLQSYREMFKGYTDICFRDSYSFNLFKDLPNIRIADDIVFQLKQNSFAKSEEKNVVISVIKPSYRKHLAIFDKVYYEKIKEITILLNKKGYHVTLMSFCEGEGDKEAVEEILKLLPKGKSTMVSVFYYKYNIKEAINLIATSNFIVATRFHSMILGWVFKKPVFPIAYSEKMTNVMKDVGSKDFYIDFKNIESLDVQLVLRSIESNKTDITRQIRESEKHFLKLDEFLIEE